MKIWNEIFAAAHRHPEFRVMHWKSFAKLAPGGATGTRKQFRHIAEAAKPYRLTDDLVWAVTKLSVELDPALLMEHAKAARMPFPCTLIEWSGQARNEAYKGLGVRTDVSDYPEHERPALMVASMNRAVKIVTDLSYDEANRSLAIFPLAYYFDPEEEYSRTEFSNLLRVAGDHSYFATNEKSGEAIMIDAATDAFMSERYGAGPEVGWNFSRRLHWMLSTSVIVKFPESAAIVEADRTVHYYPQGPLAALAIRGPKITKHDALIAGTAGNPRWFGALCFLMNQPKIVRYVQASPNPLPVGVKAREVEPGEAQVLTSFLPKEQIVTNMIRLSLKPRKAVGEHDVGGFWSTSHRIGRPDCNEGKHHWPLEHTRRQVCSECGALRWWKEDFKRGHGPAVTRKGRRLDYGGQDINRLLEAAKPPATR